MAVSIRSMRADDWPDVGRLYGDGIATGHATFQTDVPSWEYWDAHHTDICRLVAERACAVVGWAALAPISNRAVYRGVAEVSLYVAAEARGTGIGTALIARLIEESEHAGFWTLQAGIFPENRASIAVHCHAGFRVVGHREKMGVLAGRWRDVLLLERRSRVTGCDDPPISSGL